jgi:predicted component of viral defense system (DUF524 family)
VLWEPATGQSVALDAKFRLHTIAGDLAIWDSGALAEMHAYRDALNVRAAVIIYPGDLSEFWPGTGSEPVFNLAELIQVDFSGIGAVARRPRISGETSR